MKLDACHCLLTTNNVSVFELSDNQINCLINYISENDQIKLYIVLIKKNP